jgi:tetratricopeptide (TPR) repeat protein
MLNASGTDGHRKTLRYSRTAMTWLETAWRALSAIWEAHYRIPEIAYWTVFVLSLVVGIPTLGAALAITGVAMFGLVASVQGIARWRIAKRRARGAVVVPVFRCSDTGKADETQGTIISTLQDHLTPDEMKSVRAIPAIVGRADRDFAARLCKRLRAFLVLQGDIREGPEGRWSVYAGVCQRLSSTVTHIDLHTRDRTPAKADWRWAFRRLTGVDEIPQREYPLEFADELRAVVQGTGGQLAVEFGDFKRAETLLKEAIRVAPTSGSAQIDLLRIDRAKALLGQGKMDEALRLLRKRSRQEDASPELLRFLDSILRSPLNPNSTEADGREAIAALRQAAKDRSDPERDMTLYNLAQALVFSPKAVDRSEAERLVVELSESRGHYSRVWHIKRLRGVVAWRKWEEGFRKGSPDPSIAAEAARWYTRTLRARPKIKFLYMTPVGRRPYTRFTVPPILFANARDAHQRAGHRFRAGWYESRFYWKRRRLMKRGLRQLGQGKWRRAEANFDWSGSVGREDPTEVKARVFAAVAMLQYGDEEGAEAAWTDAFQLDPTAALVSRMQAAHQYDLPQGVPGEGPTDPVEVVELAAAKYGIQTAPKKRFWQL